MKNSSAKENYYNKTEEEDRFKLVIERLFLSLDVDGSGFLERNEIKMLYTILSQEECMAPPSEEMIDRMMKKYDEVPDGKLSLKELCHMLIPIITNPMI